MYHHIYGKHICRPLLRLHGAGPLGQRDGGPPASAATVQVILASDWSKVTILTSDWSRTAPGRLEAAEGEDEDEHQNLKKVRAFLEEAVLIIGVPCLVYLL